MCCVIWNAFLLTTLECFIWFAVDPSAQTGQVNLLWSLSWQGVSACSPPHSHHVRVNSRNCCSVYRDFFPSLYSAVLWSWHTAILLLVQRLVVSGQTWRKPVHFWNVESWVCSGKLEQDWLDRIQSLVFTSVLTSWIFCSNRWPVRLLQPWQHQLNMKHDVWAQLKLSILLQQSSHGGGQKDECHYTSVLQPLGRHLAPVSLCR